MFAIFNLSWGGGEDEVFLNVLRAFHLGCVPMLIPHQTLTFATWKGKAAALFQGAVIVRGEEKPARAQCSHGVLKTSTIISMKKHQKTMILKKHYIQGIAAKNLCFTPPLEKKRRKEKSK
jgi:hypothetical protein